MAENFYTLLTDIGLAKIANAQVTQEKIDLVEIAIGDGNGSYYNPSSAQTSLVKEVWRGAIGLVGIDETNDNWIIIESAIPAIDGGFFIREVGLFDSEGDLIAIGKYPETYKPKADEGSTKDLYIRMIIEVSNAASVTLKVDPTVIIASRKYVDDRIVLAITPVNQSIQQLEQGLATHEADYIHHTGYAIATGSANAYIATLNPPLSEYKEGVSFRLKINVANTGPVTVNVNGLGAKAIKKKNGNALTAGGLKAGLYYQLLYDGTSFTLADEGGEDLTELITLTNAVELNNDAIKSDFAGKLGSPSLATDPWVNLLSAFQTRKNNLAANITAKGVAASPSDALATLATKIGQINAGKKWASGTATPDGADAITIGGLGFTPTLIVLRLASNPQFYFCIYDPKYSTSNLFRYLSGTVSQPTLSDQYVNATGFRLKPGNSLPWNWVAYE